MKSDTMKITNPKLKMSLHLVADHAQDPEKVECNQIGNAVVQVEMEVVPMMPLAVALLLQKKNLNLCGMIFFPRTSNKPYRIKTLGLLLVLSILHVEILGLN